MTPTAAQQEHIGRLKALVEARAFQMDEREYLVPVSDYASAERFAAEHRILFRRYPIAVAAGDLLAEPKSCLAHDHLGLPILLTRDKEGIAHAFLNVCRHRGTRILNEEGVCKKSALVCPYHNWMYGLDGALKNVPLEKPGFPGIDKATHGLVALPCQEKHGLIWVVPEPGGLLDVDRYLGEIGPDLDALGMSQMISYRQRTTRVRANWKLIVDAFQEGYHIQRLHKTTISRFFTDGILSIDELGPHLRAVIARREFLENPEVPSEMADLRVRVTLTYYLFPNNLVVVSPDYVTLLTFYPTAPDETLVVDAMFIDERPQSDEARAHWDDSFELINETVFQREDYWVAEAAQAGLHSGANQHFIAGRFEQGIRIYHQTIDHELARHQSHIAAAE